MVDENVAVILVSDAQRSRFKSGELPKIWAQAYPEVFDDEDLRLTDTQPGYHFYEWLAAVTIFNATGYRSLVESFEFGNCHPRKREVTAKILPPSVADFMAARSERSGVQFPDLLVYNEGLTDYFFCEVKGPTDRLRIVQRELFAKIEDLSGRPVKILRFVTLKQ